MKSNLIAQSINISGQPITGPLVGISTIGDVVNKVMVFIVPLAGIILLFVFILGGYDLMMSQGAPDKLKAAQGKIVTGLIGFILLIAAYLIVKLIALIFGFGTGII
jgi:hypothetical protein